MGEVAKGGESYYIWTHKKFDIGFNDNNIVDVNLTSEAKVKLEPNGKIDFTYEVNYSFNLFIYLFNYIYTALYLKAARSN